MEKHQRLVISRFAKKLTMRSANSALFKWIEYCKERKWLRGLLNRCLGGREVGLKSAAFRTWMHMASAATEEEMSNELDDLRKQVKEQQGGRPHPHPLPHPHPHPHTYTYTTVN
jgi:hypothetical protein